MKYKYIQRTTVKGRVYLPGDPVGGELSESELAKFLDVGHVAEVVEAKPKKKKAAKPKKEAEAAEEEVTNGNGPDA